MVGAEERQFGERLGAIYESIEKRFLHTDKENIQ